ncbi:MAG TPA: hypothetical protein VK867_06135 [Candidatus Limnocylindrales bacterium]|nr:hypothetical protein [Candidatus Limnocylindrales bacterium]
MTDTSLDAFPDRSVAMVRAFSPALERGFLINGAIAVVVAILGTPLIADRMPFPIGSAVVAAIGALLGSAAAYASVPAPLRRAFESYSWLGRAEMDRFHARTGGPVPTKPDDIDRWLVSTPSTSATQTARIEVLAFVCRHAEARAGLAALQPQTPEDAFEAASLRQYIDWLETGTADTTELMSTTARLAPGSVARRMADVNLALADARVGFVQRDPTWSAALQHVRPSLGRAATMVAIRDTWLKLAGVSFALAAVVSGVVLLLR